MFSFFKGSTPPPGDGPTAVYTARPNGNFLKKLPRYVLLGLAAVLVLAIGATCWYTVDDKQQAVVTTFGKVTEVTDAGIHFKLPFGIQQVHKVDVNVYQKIELGYRTSQSSPEGYTLVEDESKMITGDYNIVNVEFFVEYKVSDPVKYLFASYEPEKILRNLIQSQVRTVVGSTNVDAVLTTRELAKMIKQANIDFTRLPDSDFDRVLGESTGAGVIFGATGGVMEAALRTAYEVITGKKLEKLEFLDVRGMKGVKEATYNLDGLELKVAVASSTGAASKLLEAVKSGEKSYTFIEVMGCPGGCINGGGQPVQSAAVRSFVPLKDLRAAALYQADRNKAVRKSHKNPMIEMLYKDFLGEPGSEICHEVLHTSYKARDRFMMAK